jgi:endonuclease G, mitochondrial
MLRTFFADNSGLALAGVRTTLGDPSTYASRPGYNPSFLSPLPPVPMPLVPSKWESDRVRLTFRIPEEADDFELRYQHFSVVMSERRRMPFFSCTNITGGEYKKVPRTNTWIYDPRIPTSAQLITDGIYGHEKEGFFSRGHMTRREDPNWGDLATAKRADADTFHVTNACPQFQTFNAPIWLGLEDYILKNTKDDDMKVSVFTGPVFDDDNDPVYKPPGKALVQVPVKFWKIVIFKHDDTGELACAAYIASQAKQLPRKNLKPAFVFGEHDDFQLSVAEVEELTGLTFGDLKDVDVLAAAGSGFRLKVLSFEELILR